LLVTANADSFHPDNWSSTFSETSALTRATQRHIPEDGILYRRCLEILKSYMMSVGFGNYAAGLRAKSQASFCGNETSLWTFQ
jgi:hypothetical protein